MHQSQRDAAEASRGRRDPVVRLAAPIGQTSVKGLGLSSMNSLSRVVSRVRACAQLGRPPLTSASAARGPSQLPDGTLARCSWVAYSPRSFGGLRRSGSAPKWCPRKVGSNLFTLVHRCLVSAQRCTLVHWIASSARLPGQESRERQGGHSFLVAKPDRRVIFDVAVNRR